MFHIWHDKKQAQLGNVCVVEDVRVILLVLDL